MLVLSRKLGESIVLNTKDGDVRIVVVDIDRGKCRIGVDAPQGVLIMRSELLAARDPEPPAKPKE